jgi:hypothetical protein
VKPGVHTFETPNHVDKFNWQLGVNRNLWDKLRFQEMLNQISFKLNSIREFYFRILSESGEFSIRKNVPYIKSFTPIFYFKFFQLWKAPFA